MRAIAAGLSDVGKQRIHNEDRFILLPEFSVYVVADGMGGHQSGEVASRMAASTIASFFRAGGSRPADDAPASGVPSSAKSAKSPASARTPTSTRPPASAAVRPPASGRHPLGEQLKNAVTHANARIFARADDSRAHRGMGTTVVAAAFHKETAHLCVAHAGDSRCYRLRGGRIDQLTRDHSLVSDALLERPDLSPTDLAYLPKNVITRALGIAPTVDVELRVEPCKAGDVFLLCSDGLHGLVSDEEIVDIIQSTPVLTDACAALVERANAAGGKDNITAVLIRIENDDDPWRVGR